MPDNLLMFPNHGKVPALQNKESRLAKYLDAIFEVRDVFLFGPNKNETVLAPVVMAFQSAAKRECSSYAYFRGEKWSPLCNAGADGILPRGSLCQSCILYASAGEAPAGKSLVQIQEASCA